KKGVNSQYKQNRTNTVADFYFNYVKDFSNIKSRLDLTAGSSYNDYLAKIYNYATFNAIGDRITAEPDFEFDKPQNRLISYFGRLNYNYDEKYYLTATIRRDGSSRFGKDFRYGTS